MRRINVYEGDYCDFGTYVVKYQDLCTETDKLVNWVETVQQVCDLNLSFLYFLFSFSLFTNL